MKKAGLRGNQQPSSSVFALQGGGVETSGRQNAAPTWIRCNHLIYRILAVLALFVCAVPAQTQELPRIAVYVTGSGVSDNEKSALGTRLLASLINSGRYMGIERSNSFLAEIDKEQLKQRSGAIDDGQISALGRQFGVKFVCVANITPVLGDFQVSARIINVETAQINFIGESYSRLKNVVDLVQVSDQVVRNMFSGQVATLREPKPEPVVASQSDANGSYFTDSRDGKKYRTVKIGEQTWTAENLNYKAGASWCYGNDEPNCEKYGRLYDWQAAKFACPSGWRLPTSNDWKYLIEVIGDKRFAGKMLKSKSDWRNNGNGTDDYGFSAMPGGNRNSEGSFNNVGNNGNWWSATENGTNVAYNRYMYYGYDDVGEGNNNRSNGFSVRCVKN